MESSEQVHEIVYRTVRRRILSGEYPPGSKLGEISLAAEFGCSRTPIRESFKQLEHDRLLEIRPKSGTYVRAETRSDYIHLMQVRAYLESLAYRILHPKVTKSNLAALERMVLQMDGQRTAAGGGTAGLAALHIAFHLKMVELAGNPLLLRLYRQLNFRASIMLYFEMDELVFRRVQKEHRRILDALAERDPEGEVFVRESIIQSMERHLALWDEADGNGSLK